MFHSLKNLQLKEAVPRLCADFVIVQVAALISLTYALVVRVQSNPHEHGDILRLVLQGYYTDVFLPLSVIFPITFLVSGVYTTSRYYKPPYKYRELGTSCLVTTGLLVAATVSLSGALHVPRASILIFAMLVVCGTIGIRMLKHYLVDTELAGAMNGVHSTAQDDRILVVGGAGYIGSVLVRQLLERGKHVRVLDKCIYGRDSLQEISGHPSLEIIEGDCRNIQTVVTAVKDVRSVVHLAAIVGDPACELDRQTALAINYAATRMIAEIAKGDDVKRFVFASSCSVYGASDVLADENTCPNPISLYAQTKVDSENALLLAQTNEFHPTILRFATVFGYSYRPRFDLLVNLLTAKATQEGVITIFNGEQWRPFIHVRDVAGAIARTLEAPLGAVAGEIFNVGDANLNYTLMDVAQHIRCVLPATRLEHVHNADRRNYRVAFNKISTQLGFECAVSLNEGIVEIKEAIEAQSVAHYREPKYHNDMCFTDASSSSDISKLDADIMAAFSRPVDTLVENGNAQLVRPGTSIERVRKGGTVAA